MKYKIFAFTLLMIFSTKIAHAETIMMSCPVNHLREYGPNELLKYEYKFLFKDKASSRSEGSWITICPNINGYTLSNLVIKDGSAICTQTRTLTLARKRTLPEKNACLREINAEINMNVDNCKAVVSIFDDFFDCCQDRFIPTNDKFYVQTTRIFDFVTKKLTVKNEIPDYPKDRKPLRLNEHDGVGLGNYIISCDKEF